MLLSICIPTCNRSAYLRRTLDSIVSQSAWAEGECEIVISDNGSPDDTWTVISEFSRKFPQLIRGLRQDPPIHSHFNFEAALRMGQGEFLKLNNDTLAWREGALAEYLALARQVRGEADLILTPNARQAPVYGRIGVRCADLDEVLRQCSYFLTWIGTVCFRREAFLALPDPSRDPEKCLTQTDMILRMVSAGATAFADGRIFFDSMPVPRKNPKSLIQVFSINFPDMVGGYVPEKIRRGTFAKVKRSLFRQFIIPTAFDYFHEDPEMERPGYWRTTVRYHREWYFWTGFLRIAALRLLGRCFTRETLRRIKRALLGGGGG